ncbi:cupin-like domain-containing protein [Methylovirgula sp. 4M-Z18]|uniref:cupin-like domain-containing protein n=1 Tax=Methylovirgula sp. 4M-Z18 TaxID=2293567 RepID=UPI000E2F809E|nr:cupin-like domain-containing protein [Methylovirgula sp. 4M-Z18]RFB78683.1 transcription factor [Methylovirgula sp. 4M-Z18]
MQKHVDPAKGFAPDNAPLLQVSAEDFRANFNKRSFEFRHRLQDTKLFEIDQLIELADKILAAGATDRFAAVNYRQANVGTKIGTTPNLGLRETVSKLDQAGSWVKLSRVQDFDPKYTAVFDQLLFEMEGLLNQPLRREITWSTVTIFLASPKIATPFHIDHESNFLFQLQGDKDVCLFDPNDRELVNDKEVEAFYLGNAGAATYKEHLQARGTVYRLTPGDVVHHPPLAPHWVKNGDNISVSVSVAFGTKPLERVARIYQANSLLRTFGLAPVSPGLSPTKDKIKAAFVSRFENRNPRSYADLMFTPVNRLRKPIELAKRVIRRSAQGRGSIKTTV